MSECFPGYFSLLDYTFVLCKQNRQFYCFIFKCFRISDYFYVVNQIIIRDELNFNSKFLAVYNSCWGYQISLIYQTFYCHFIVHCNCYIYIWSPPISSSSPHHPFLFLNISSRNRYNFSIAKWDVNFLLVLNLDKEFFFFYFVYT